MSLNYELYKVFYFVAKNLSFSKAAKELYISQSAVSQNIKNLEKELKTRLFIRNTKEVSLTQAGEVLFEHIEPAFNLIKTGEKNIKEINALKRGEIHIGANDTIAKDYLLPYLNEFHKLYPQIHIQITNRTSSTCVELLKQNAVDLIISNLPNPKITDDMLVNEIFEFEDIFICSNQYPKLKNKKISLHDLKNYPLLMLEEKTSTRKFFDELLKKYNIDLKPEVELGSVDLLIEMTKIGLGIAHVPQYSLNLSQNELFKIKIKEKLPTRKLAVVRNKELPLSKAAERFLKVINCF
ncbi:transcriptional regulator, LysR family [Halanaerobium hydrogeniformans]|uniref:Transcriptional regulator, LysR family n=2 Tax=Halanaerobium hydrogeniformans TaxID=656519 RepID=E4RJM1_HALHG|nr:transcriptional regulator, LysR family [Halanaerobium hydrogeniformans]